MNTDKVNELIENFYNSFYEIENFSIKQVLKALTPTELHIIEAIGRESLTMNELSERLRITMGTATVAVTKLSDKEFIERRRSTSDRRKVYVTLSQKGIEALDYHKNFHKDIISNITKNLSEAEMISFINVFSKILCNLELELEYAKPLPLSDFSENITLQIIKIKGSPAMQEFFLEKSIAPGATVIVNRIGEDTMIIEELSTNKRIPISNVDAKNIFVIKKTGI